MSKNNYVDKMPLFMRAFVSLFYIGFGIYVWVTKSFVVKLSDTPAFALGLVLIAYGLFRGYTSYTAYKNDSK